MQGDSLDDRLDRIEHLLRTLVNQQRTLMADLTALQAAVEEDATVDASAITLIEQLAATVESLKTDPVALQAFVDQLRAQSAGLAAAVTANTPAAPAPEPEPGT